MLRPPVGVAILGFLALIAGVANLIVGLQLTGWVVIGPASLGSGVFLYGVMTLILALVFIAAAYALWATQPWAWLFTSFIAIFGLIDAVFVAIATESFVDGFAVALLPLVTLWYLSQDDIRRVFGVDGRADPSVGCRTARDQGGGARRIDATMRTAPNSTRAAGQNHSRCRSGTAVRTRKYVPITIRMSPPIAAPVWLPFARRAARRASRSARRWARADSCDQPARTWRGTRPGGSGAPCDRRRSRAGRGRSGRRSGRRPGGRRRRVSGSGLRRVARHRREGGRRAGGRWGGCAVRGVPGRIVERVLRHDDRHDDVGHEEDAAGDEGEKDPPHPDERWIEIEVLGEPAGDAGDHAVGAGPIKPFVHRQPPCGLSARLPAFTVAWRSSFTVAVS